MPRNGAQRLNGLGSAYRTDAGSGRRVRLYSRLVTWMKITLPLLALAGIAVFYISTRHTGELDEIFSAQDLATLGAGLKLESPSFAGITRRGERYAISAEWAVPDSAVPTYVELERPKGEIELQGRGWVTVTATTGRLHRGEKVLVLKDEVILRTEDGYHLTTDQLHFALGTQVTYAPGAISGTGPNGQIEAGSMRLVPADPDTGTGTQIWFENRVRLVLSPAGAG